MATLLDNFDAVQRLLDFSEPGYFYIIQLMQRKKDNPTLDKQRKLLNIYYIYSIDEYMKLKSSIIEKCISLKARAYLIVNKRNSLLTAYKTLEYTSQYLQDGQPHLVQNAFNKAAGQQQKVYYWLLDVDSKSGYDKVIKYIESHPKQSDLKQNSKHIEVIDIIKTVNGYHFIVKPFNPIDYCDYMDISTSSISITKNSIQENQDITLSDGSIIKYANTLLCAYVKPKEQEINKDDGDNEKEVDIDIDVDIKMDCSIHAKSSSSTSIINHSNHSNIKKKKKVITHDTDNNDDVTTTSTTSTTTSTSTVGVGVGDDNDETKDEKES